jgi:hypothetical protein
MFRQNTQLPSRAFVFFSFKTSRAHLALCVPFRTDDVFLVACVFAITLLMVNSQFVLCIIVWTFRRNLRLLYALSKHPSTHMRYAFCCFFLSRLFFAFFLFCFVLFEKLFWFTLSQLNAHSSNKAMDEIKSNCQIQTKLRHLQQTTQSTASDEAKLSQQR